MDVNLPAAGRRWFSFLLLTLGAHSVPAYQIADGAGQAVSAAPKFIFYWGDMQCELTPANAFKGAFTLTPAAFHNMLLHAPALWTGSTLAPAVSFRLEGRSVVATRGANDYAEGINALDAFLNPKAAPGQVLHITELLLDAPVRGAIDITIQTPETAQPGSGRNRFPLQREPYTNEQFLQRVIWGREDIQEVSNRDFFSEAEFWQTIRQLPYVEWKPGITPRPVSVAVNFLDENGASTFGVVHPLEDNQYRQLVELLNHYRHLVRPGAVIQLRMYSTERYDEFFRKTVTIVDDNDPRLSLRRSRDLHEIQLQWGSWTATASNLYLLRFPAGRGPAISVDPPVYWNDVRLGGGLSEMLGGQPECRVDGQLIPGLSFRLSIPTDSFELEVREALPDTLVQDIAARFGSDKDIRLDHFQLPGIDLPVMECTFPYIRSRNRFLFRNDLSVLATAPGSARIKLYAPTLADTELFVDFDLPEQASVEISVFEPEGRNIFLVSEQPQAGRHTAHIPMTSFRRKGKYYIFLNTPFGVAKQELNW